MALHVLVVVWCLALVAQAGVETVSLGVLKVPSSEKETIVSVPWLEPTANDRDISVSNLVLTAGLTEGDELMVYTGTGYSCWRLDGNKHWTPGTTVSSSKVTTAAGASDARLARGGAFILRRTGDNLSNGFYIKGKPTTNTVTTTLGAGYSLVAPPSTTATDVNTGLTWSGVVTGDQLFIPAQPKPIELWWRVKGDWSGWRRWDGTTWSAITLGITIPAGTGAWFKNSGSTTKSVSWENKQ